MIKIMYVINQRKNNKSLAREGSKWAVHKFNKSEDYKSNKLFSFFHVFANLGLQLASRRPCWCTERLRKKSSGNLTLLL